MGLMDKVKAQANQLAQKTQEAAQEGKAKLDQAQANRRGDALLRQLGALVYADRTGRGTPDTQAKIEQLINDISAHEQANGLIPASPQPNTPQPNVPQPGHPADNPGQYPGSSGSTFIPTGSTSDAGQVFPPPGGGPDVGSAFPPPGTQFFPPPDEAGSGQSGQGGY